MKLQISDQSAQVQGALSTTNFSIEANAQAFLTLSEKMYSNKIGAVIRELSTNAYDSHTEFGNPEVPFMIHMPNASAPYFAVRDFGTGLSDPNCRMLYTTYFKSTRNDSNQGIGCFGLGSKSPFAYAESFTVESYFNGKKYSYAAYKDADGPHFDLMETTDTDEPNGLMVKVPVQESDMWDFRREAVKVYNYFKVKPEVTGYGLVFDDNETSLLSGDNWGVYTGESRNILIMGQVAYPLVSQPFANYPHLQTFLDNVHGFRIEVNIGDAEITPSRESLSYTKATVANLAAILEEIPKQISASVSVALAKEPTLFKARMAYLNMDRLLINLCDEVSYKGQKLFDDMRSKTIALPSSGFTRFFKYRHRRGIIRENSPNVIKFTTNISNVVFADIKCAHTGRIKQFISNNGWSDDKGVLLCNDLQSILKVLGDATQDDITLLSSLPLPDKSSRNNSGGSVPCHVYVEDTEEFVESKLSVKFANAYYLTETYGQVRCNNRSVKICLMADIIKCLINAGAEFDGDFYLVKPSFVSNQRLNKRPNWTNGIEVLNAAYKELMEDNIEDFALAKDNASFGELKRADKIFPTGEIADLVQEYKDHRELVNAASSRVNGLVKISEYFPVIVTPNVFEDNYFEDEYARMTEKYTMLDSFRYGKESDITQYIQDMDELFRLRKILSNVWQMA